MGAEVSCVVADLTLGTSTGAGADWTPATPTRGVGTVGGVSWFTASLALGDSTDTSNGWAAAVPT